MQLQNSINTAIWKDDPGSEVLFLVFVYLRTVRRGRAVILGRNRLTCLPSGVDKDTERASQQGHPLISMASRLQGRQVFPYKSHLH